jgi:GntR family transcriptional repressor for pyruvate dehydrogenase complex
MLQFIMSNPDKPLGNSTSSREKHPQISGTSPKAAARRGGLVTNIVNQLSDDIRSQRLKVGTKLPTEAEWMLRFGVSRTVVREAISRLVAGGLVVTRHGIGTFVAETAGKSTFRISQQELVTIEDVIAVLELRISLETEAAGLAAQRREEPHLEAMSRALAAFKDAIDHERDAVPSDFQFHMEVAKATGNRYITDLMTYLGTMIIPRTRVNTPQLSDEGRDAYLQRVHGEHENIYNAIRNRDADAARAAMRMHLSNSRDRLRKKTSAD